MDELLLALLVNPTDDETARSKQMSDTPDKNGNLGGMLVKLLGERGRVYLHLHKHDEPRYEDEPPPPAPPCQAPPVPPSLPPRKDTGRMARKTSVPELASEPDLIGAIRRDIAAMGVAGEEST